MAGFDTGAVLAAAHSGAAASGYDRVALEELARAIGCDAAAYVRPTGPGAALGFYAEATWRAQLVRRFQRYEREIAPLTAKILAGGVGLDTEACRHYRKTDYYRELVAPEGAHGALYGGLTMGGTHLGTIMVSRRSGEFSPRDKLDLAAALPALSVCEMALQASSPPPFAAHLVAHVSPRELEILEYLRLGYRNRDIALALGTSPNTVRNQLSGLYEKLGVASRSEAVAVAMDSNGARTLLVSPP